MVQLVKICRGIEYTKMLCSKKYREGSAEGRGSEFPAFASQKFHSELAKPLAKSAQGI